jgi:hypothetical protein
MGRLPRSPTNNACKQGGPVNRAAPFFHLLRNTVPVYMYYLVWETLVGNNEFERRLVGLRPHEHSGRQEHSVMAALYRGRVTGIYEFTQAFLIRANSPSHRTKPHDLMLPSPPGRGRSHFKQLRAVAA